MAKLVFTAVVALSVMVYAAGAQAGTYQAPSRNYYQNSWMNG